VAWLVFAREPSRLSRRNISGAVERFGF